MKLNIILASLRALIPLMLLAAGAARAAAQVTMNVVFSNLGASFDAPISGVDGVTLLSTPNFHSELIYDRSPIGGSATTLAASTTTWVEPGYFIGAMVPITGFNSGTAVTFHVRVWDDGGSGFTFDQATDRSISKPVNLVVPEPPPPGTPLTMTLPMELTGLQAFQLQTVPEPGEALLGASFACIVFGAALRLARQSGLARRR